MIHTHLVQSASVNIELCLCLLANWLVFTERLPGLLLFFNWPVNNWNLQEVSASTVDKSARIEQRKIELMFASMEPDYKASATVCLQQRVACDEVIKRVCRRCHGQT